MCGDIKGPLDLHAGLSHIVLRSSALTRNGVRIARPWVRSRALTRSWNDSTTQFRGRIYGFRHVRQAQGMRGGMADLGPGNQYAMCPLHRAPFIPESAFSLATIPSVAEESEASIWRFRFPLTRCHYAAITVPCDCTTSDGGGIIASITLRHLDDEVTRRLRIRAAENGRSMEQEVRVVLREALLQEPSPGPGKDLAEAIRSRFAPYGGVELELPSREPMCEPPKCALKLDRC